MEDILQEIPNDKLPELKKIIYSGYPENIHVYCLIETTIQLKKKIPNDNYVKIYCPNGDFSDGTFIAIMTMGCYDILIYTLDKSQKRLEKALRETKKIDYDKQPFFSAMFRTYLNMMENIKADNPKLFDIVSPCYSWWLPKEKALKYEYTLPDDIYVAPLNKTHADIMNEVWPHKYPDSEKYLAKLIEVNGAIGLFSKNNHELCAWVLKNYFGGLGMLQVAESHKRKGYGSLIAKIFSKMIAENDGNDLSGFIVEGNYASQGMFTKLGFQKLTPLAWLMPFGI